LSQLHDSKKNNECVDKLKGRRTEQSRAERAEYRAEPSRAGQSRAERAELKVGQSIQIEQSRAGQGRAGRAEKNRAGQSRVKRTANETQTGQNRTTLWAAKKEQS
jgi:hypothetical protein